MPRRVNLRGEHSACPSGGPGLASGFLPALPTTVTNAAAATQVTVNADRAREGPDFGPPSRLPPTWEVRGGPCSLLAALARMALGARATIVLTRSLREADVRVMVTARANHRRVIRTTMPREANRLGRRGDPRRQHSDRDEPDGHDGHPDQNSRDPFTPLSGHVVSPLESLVDQSLFETVLGFPRADGLMGLHDA
jgi:hypothetical protein